MLISKNTSLNVLDIWAPKYATRTVLIATYKVKEHNKIIFSKAKHLKGREYYISGTKAKTYPTIDNGKVSCYNVPMDDLEVLEYKEDVAITAKDLFAD